MGEQIELMKQIAKRFDIWLNDTCKDLKIDKRRLVNILKGVLK